MMVFPIIANNPLSIVNRKSSNCKSLYASDLTSS